MTREPWPVEQRGSFKRIPGDDTRLSIVSGAFPTRPSSKIELQGSGRALQQPQQPQQQQQPSQSPPQQKLPDQHEPPCERTSVTTSMVPKSPSAGRRGSLLGSLKAYYRKLRTFKGTVRALIYLRRTPLSLSNAVKSASTSVPVPAEDQRSAALGVPRISTTATSAVQSQIHKLVAEGYPASSVHVVTEIDPTSGKEVTYRQQGNLDHYTEDSLAKRVSLQQHPNMIALTQRLWNCALRNGEKRLRFGDYETYMLCLHRLILPEFDIAASKELINDDWKRDNGGQEYLDYAYFHLSMFELVDLWTDTVDPEDYIALLYCITHCLTFPYNDHHAQKPLEDIRAVDILEESKEINLEGIDQDLQREINSASFAYYREQVKQAAEANQAIERGENDPSTALGQQQSQNQQTDSRTASRSRSRERKRSSKSEHPAVGLDKDSNVASQGRLSSRSYSQDHSKRKFSQQSNSNGLDLVAEASGLNTGTARTPLLTTPNAPSESLSATPRRDTGLQRATSPNMFTRGGGVILNVGIMDGLVISKPIVDGKPSLAVPTVGMTGFPRRRSRSASIANQNRRDQVQAAVAKGDSTRDASLLSTQRIEASGSALRTGAQDPGTPGYLLNTSGPAKYQEPFTVRAAAVAEAAAAMATSSAPINKRQTVLMQRTQHQLQLRSAQPSNDGSAGLSATKTSAQPSNFFMDKSSLTAPMMTIVSSKAQLPQDRPPSISKLQLQLQEIPDRGTYRPQTPYGGGLVGASLTSPRVGHAPSAQAAAAFISAPHKPPVSPRQTVTVVQRNERVLSPNTDHLSPTSPRRSQVRQHDESLVLATGSVGGLMIGSIVPLAISGRTAAHNSPEMPSSPPRQSKPDSISGPHGLLDNILGSSLLTPGASETVTTTNQPKNDLKALLSPRYIVSNPIGSVHSAHFSMTPASRW